MEKRIIKFRAFDKRINQMFYSDDSQTVWMGGAEVSVNSTKGKISGDFIGMQFTGLFDKFGNEIYEGDLLHRHMNVYWKVVFKDSKWIADEITPTCSLYLDASQFVQAEIIGNIFEHSHLITN